MIRLVLGTLLAAGLLGGCGEGHDGAALLGASHPGWKRAVCASAGCHPGAHQGAYRAPRCAECHGTNGAAVRDHAGQFNPCNTCHVGVDHLDAFAIPSECMVCHAEVP